MLKRTWHVTTPVGERTLTLHRNRITGLHTLYADDEVIYKEDGRWKHHLFHAGTIDDTPYELSVTVYKGVFHAYLIINRVCVPADGEDDTSADYITGQQMLKARSYCQKLADATGLKYYPHPGIPEWHRLVGVFDGYLVLMEYSNANEYQDIPYCSLLVRHQKTEDKKVIQEALITDAQLAAFQQKLELDDKLRVGHAPKMTGYRIPFSDDVHILSESIGTLLEIVKPYLRPTPLHTCEESKCKSDYSEPLNLMIYNGIIPQVSCKTCATKHLTRAGVIKPLPIPGRDMHWVMRMMIISAFIYGVVSAFIYQEDSFLMQMIGLNFFMIIPIFIYERTRMKFTARNMVALYGLAICGVLGSIYSSVAVDMLMRLDTEQGYNWLKLLMSAVLHANPIAFDSLVFIGVITLVMLGSVLLGQGLKWLRPAVVSDPPVGVELVSDFPLKSDE